MTHEQDIHHINQPTTSSPSDNMKEKEEMVPTHQLVHNKAWMLFGVLCLLAVSIIIKVFYLQIFPDEHAQNLAKNFTYKIRDIQPVRGQIISSDGSLLATSVPVYDIRWDSKAGYDVEEYLEKLDSLSLCFSKLFGDKSAAEYKSLFKRARANGSRYTEIKMQASYTQLQAVKKFPLVRRGQYKSGFVFEQKHKRQKPFGSLAARTIGLQREDNQVGLELAYDKELSGKKGKQYQEKITGGIWKPMSNDFIEAPEPGADIVSTIDVHLQDVAHAALRRQLEQHRASWGCVVLMEVETGFVRAIANLSENGHGGYEEMLNLAISQSVEPGSTNKLASLMACLDEGAIALEDSVATGNGIKTFYGVPMKDSNWDKKGPNGQYGNGTITAEQVFEKSSNIGTALLVQKSFGKDPQKFLDKLHSFKLDQLLGIEIPGEGSPHIYNTTKEKGWSGLSLTQMAIGYEMRLTPLQILTFYNGVANDGTMVRPQFVQEIRKNGRKVHTSKPIVLNEGYCRRSTIKDAKRMMEGTMREGGTAATVFKNSPYTVAGKTGTAWVNDGGGYVKNSFRGSLVGYFPADEPKYSCVVVIHNPRSGVYYGGSLAGPVFKELADKIYSTQMEFHAPASVEINTELAQMVLPVSKGGAMKELQTVFKKLDIPLDIQSKGDWVSTSTGKDSVVVTARHFREGVVPNVVGMGLQDALFLLENKGLKVRVSGYGTVKRQSVPAGTSVKSNPFITIELS